MKMEHELSDEDIAEIVRLLNSFLAEISLVPLSCSDVDSANPDARPSGTQDDRYHGIVKVINRWGLEAKNGEYHALLNKIIWRITACSPMFGVDRLIELLLFNKLFEGWRNRRSEFTCEEVHAFFLLPLKIDGWNSIPVAAVSLYDLARRTQMLSRNLKSSDSYEFLLEGVCRRLFMLKATVDAITEIYTPQRAEPLKEDETVVLTQNIHFFYANLCAIIDCLAFVLAFEHPSYRLKRADRNKLREVDLFEKDFYRKIDGLTEKVDIEKAKPWHKDIVNLRHPIAHRIPLYFPDIRSAEDAPVIRKIDGDYFAARDAALQDSEKSADDQVRELDTLEAKWRERKATVDTFSGCFLHSRGESKKSYHLSRLALDLGMLYYLLDGSFEYLRALLTKNPE
jgi:hypothetical protein